MSEPMVDAQGREVVPVPARGRPRGSGRKDLRLVKPMTLKLHPDLSAYLDRASTARYCTVQEYIRQLIVDDMRSADGSEWGR